MEKEIWKDVVGYEGYYQISSLGRVKRLRRTQTDSLGRLMTYKERFLKISVSRRTGYPYVGLSKGSKRETKNIHSLIADAFIPNPNNLPCVNHIDENRRNSVLSNLERCTYSYNNSYGSAVKKRLETYRKNSKGKHKLIYQFNLDGRLLNVYDCGVKSLSKQLGYDIDTCLTGNSKTAHGYVFSYSKTFSYQEDKPKRHQKYVKLIDDNGNTLHLFKSVSEAAMVYGVDRHKFCKESKKLNTNCVTINGLKFVIEKKDHEYIPVGHKGARPDLLGINNKPVYQYGKDGSFIKGFASVKEAALSIGNRKYAPSISSCAHGNQKTAHGYIWSHDKK